MDNFNNIDTIQSVAGLMGNNTGDMTKTINAIYCSAGVGGDTALLIDDTITTMESMYNFRSGSSLPTYAIGGTGVVESHMMSIPMDNVVEQATQNQNSPMYQQQQIYLDNIRSDSQLSDKSKHGMKMMYANELYIITFDNDFHISCTEGTQFLYIKEDGSYDWKNAKDLKVGDKMVGAEVGDQAKIDVVEVHVTSAKLHKCIAREPVYLFMCEHQNILLPNIKNNKLSFICIHQ